MTGDSTSEILDAACKAGAQQAEVFQARSQETPVRFEANRLKGLNSRQTSGLAVRVIADGRVGFASSTRPGDVDGVIAAALETAPFGPEAHFDFARRSEALAIEVYDPLTASLSVDDMIETGQSLIDQVRRMQPDVLCEGSVRRAVSTVTLANTNGGGFSYQSSTLSASIFGTLIRGTDMLFVGDGDVSCTPNLDTKRIEDTIMHQLEYSRRHAQVQSAELPVIFTAIGVAGALLTPLTMAFSGRLVHQGQSPLVGCLGKAMYDRRFSMFDDATMPMRPAARPFDDEGVPSRRISMIERGIARSFLYDLQTAGLAKAESTGSAERALTTQPSISTTCLTLEPGDTTFEEMVRGVKEGVVIEELMGAGQGNVLGGDFSGNVLLGYKIESGQIVGRVKDTIVAGNVHEALNQLVTIGSEARWVGGSVFTPPLMFGRLTVASKS